MEPNEKWYSVKEVAGMKGVSVDTVRRWIRRGLLKAFRMPVRSDRQHRKYECFRISDRHLDRFWDGNMA
jgi:excisionase family DNA binding protein